ncbi:hypothetical protein DYE48_18700 [Halobacillus trueperi]|uniref:Uncharacterized protein n=1 Tax=Halobacillus trueperi TaxID=156205 RepID=A0A3E0J0U9_9BACI|nr:hypothetical protein DYE48_18700 [Halobacillus trueperi]
MLAKSSCVDPYSSMCCLFKRA